MENATPNIIEHPQSSVGEGNAKIAVAIPTIPENGSVLFCWTCEKALAAGLRRSSVPVVESVSLLTAVFATAVFTIPTARRGAALESVKQTLTELDLLTPATTIAMDRAGESWIILHGLGVGGTRFQEGFLRPDLVAASVVVFRKWIDDYKLMWQILREDLTRQAAAEGQKPEGL